MITYKAYDETTADDFRRLFMERFPDGDPAILDVFLSNPVRKLKSGSGRIAYDDAGRVIAIQGVLPRVAYFGRERLLSANAVAMAVRKDVDRSFFTGFLRNTVQESGADLMFGNTAIPGSRRRLQAAVNVQDGPVSCALIRERTLRGNGIAVRLIRKLRKLMGWNGEAARLESAPDRTEAGGLVFARETAIEGDAFDSFWGEYLETNEGLASSRTAEELRWMFGKGLTSGEVVLLTARRAGGGALGDRPLPSAGVLQGYVFCRRTDETAACWRVVDLIAMKNDGEILTALIEAVSDFLRRRTSAICLQITGYPMWVQPLLARLFPKQASFGFNKCIWTYLNERAKVLCGDWVNAKTGWYGCPYDGDMCLM